MRPHISRKEIREKEVSACWLSLVIAVWNELLAVGRPDVFSLAGGAGAY
jgi:hypothetical protein